MAQTPSTGYCRDVQLVGDCDVSEMGFWKLSQSQASSWSTALAACRELCAGCAGCSYVSASLRARECSWYESCDLQALQSEQPGFRSVAVTGRPRVEPLISAPPAEEEPKPQIAWPLRGGRELRCAARRLARGEPTKVSFFGTSVTAGHHLGTSHVEVAEQALRRRLPRANLTVHKLGFPGASPQYQAACLKSMVPERADVYVLEFSDNGRADLTEEYEASIRGLVAALRQRQTAPAILLLPLISGRCTTGVKHAAIRRRRGVAGGDVLAAVETCLGENTTLAARMEAVCEEEKLPCLSMRRALAAPMRWHARNGSAVRYVDRLMAGAHPRLPGYALLGEIVAEAILGAADKTDTGCLAPQGRSATGHAHGRSVATQLANNNNRVCAMEADMHPFVRRSQGWNYVTEFSSLQQPKPGYIATEPGAELELCFRVPPTDSTGHFELWLAYLESYKRMGVATAACVLGCACQTLRLDAHIDARVSQPKLARLIVKATVQLEPASDACPCVVRLTNTASTRSGQHKFKLVALLSGFHVPYHRSPVVQV